MTDKKDLYLLRHHKPGDLRMVIHKHGDLYAEEYSWNEQLKHLWHK
ncbi:hypothetical protein PH210_07380 [Paenibacillus sp. BSR1-1]|nr:hypothetical protein [Paenibacillus sp. BSR1-1]MDN3016028.1 hypothetical protein [Paenibacillus sp. BSR1-1]